MAKTYDPAGMATGKPPLALCKHGSIHRQLLISGAKMRTSGVILSGGQVVNAIPRENSDLGWALKGGSNYFGVITRFDMDTLPLSYRTWRT